MVLWLSLLAPVYPETSPITTETPDDEDILDKQCPAECECRLDDVQEIGIENLIVDCKKRKLLQMPDFSRLSERLIYRIYLDENDLTGLGEASFSGLQLEGLQLAKNGGITRLNAEDFEGVNSHLNYLSLRRTALGSRPAAFLRNMTAIQTLDLAEIQTEQFWVITKDTLGTVYTLEELNLANNGIAQIKDFAFQGLPTLMILNLDDNILESVPKAVNSLSILQELSVARIGLRGIKEYTLQGLQNLRHLNLEGNMLMNGTIHPRAFWMSPGQSLEVLSLRSNRFEAVPTHLFSTLRNLRKLDLSANMITEIPDRAFYNLERLEELDLSNNPVTLSEKSMAGLDGLRVLHMRGLKLTSVPTNVISPLISLADLDLSANQIQQIENDSFATLSLEKVSLVFNRLKDVSPAAFNFFYTPSVVILSDNDISDLTFLTESHCVFSRLELDSNPLVCDCDLYSFLVKHPGEFDLSGHCDSPANMRGVQLDSLSENAELIDSCPYINTTEIMYEHEECAWSRTIGAAPLVTSSLTWMLILQICMIIVHHL